MPIKVAFIGAGSIGFTRGLLSDILSVPEFKDISVSFMDINRNNLDMITQLCQRDIDSNGLDIKIHATMDRKDAFKDADYVINSVRIGGLHGGDCGCEFGRRAESGGRFDTQIRHRTGVGAGGQYCR